MDKKGFGAIIVLLILIGIAVVGAVSAGFANRKRAKYEAIPTPLVTPLPAGTSTTNIVITKNHTATLTTEFEGTESLGYGFSYPEDFQVVSENDGRFLIIKEPSSTIAHTIRISFEGGRGFTPSDVWNEDLKAKCNCRESTSTISIRGVTAIETFENDAKKWVVFLSPVGMSQWLFTAELSKSSQHAERILESFNFSNQDTAPVATTTIKLYFINPSIKPIRNCDELVEVAREVPKIPRIGALALQKLLEGPTSDEAKDGFTSSIPQGTVLNSLSVTTGTAKADFNDAMLFSGGGCDAKARLEQVRKTLLLQFPAIKKIFISIDGKTEAVPQSKK